MHKQHLANVDPLAILSLSIFSIAGYVTEISNLNCSQIGMLGISEDSKDSCNSIKFRDQDKPDEVKDIFLLLRI